MVILSTMGCCVISRDHARQGLDHTHTQKCWTRPSKPLCFFQQCLLSIFSFLLSRITCLMFYLPFSFLSIHFSLKPLALFLILIPKSSISSCTFSEHYVLHHPNQHQTILICFKVQLRMLCFSGLPAIGVVSVPQNGGCQGPA